MLERERRGKRSIKETQQVRARPAKLERISRTAAEHTGADTELDKAWSEWETTFDAIRDSIMLLDGEFKIVQANAATSRLLGRPLDEIVGKKCCRLVHGADEPPEGCPLRKAQSTKKRQKAELHIVEKNMWAAVSVDPILDDQGNMTGAVHIIRDITTRKKAEEALRESERNFRNIFENAVLGLYRTTPDGRILMANSALLRMLGYASLEELARRDLEDAGFEPDYPRSIFKERMEADGQIIGLESAWVRRDGETVYLRESAKAVRDADGNTLYYEGTVEDITERRRAEKALNEERDMAQKYLDVVGVIMVALDSDGRVRLMNRKGCEILGFPEAEIIGKNWFDSFLPESEPDRVKAVFRKLMAGEIEPVEYFENPILTKDGSERLIAWHNTVVRNEDGDITGVLNSGEDITERKKAERKLLSKQAELKALTSELSLAEERERRRIAAGIHDDIGQKLALAKLELQMFMSSPGDSKMPAPGGPAPRGPGPKPLGGRGPVSLEGVCATIDNAIEDCHSLTFELSNPALYELSFEAAIEQWLYEQIQKKHGIECEVAVKGDPVQPDEKLKVTLFRAIREAAVNVVKHAKATALRVSIERIGDNVQVALADNGTGFVVDPAGAALSMDKAGGFGLFNVKERLEHLGGNLKIESAPGRGTTITLTAPLEHQGNKQRKGAEK